MWYDVLAFIGLLAVIAVLLLVNSLGVLLVALQLPGTWLMMLGAVLFTWWRHDVEGFGSMGIRTAVVLLLLAIMGEVIEFIAGAWGARSAGGSKRAAVLAIVCGVLGAITGGIFLSVVPVIGTLFGALIGAVIGCGIGSMLGDRWAGKDWQAALRTGRGAAVGKFWGAGAKLGIAILMWVIIAVAVLLPW